MIRFNCFCFTKKTVGRFHCLKQEPQSWETGQARDSVNRDFSGYRVFFMCRMGNGCAMLTLLAGRNPPHTLLDWQTWKKYTKSRLLLCQGTRTIDLSEAPPTQATDLRDSEIESTSPRYILKKSHILWKYPETQIR